MPRLFATTRELDFISDITKEIIHDVVGQVIYYYPISELKTKTHDVYNEAVKKIYDNPIIIGCLVDSSFEKDTTINKSGIDKNYKIEVFIQYRDMLERGITPSIGDFFSYSDIVFEISECRSMRNIFGLAEHQDGMRLVGHPAREGLIDVLLKGPTDLSYLDEDAVQNQFYQQRGFHSNNEGDTNDHRDLIEKQVIETIADKPREISQQSDNHNRSTFYDED